MARLFQMKSLNYPIIKLTIYFASGILISDFIEPTFQKLTYSLSTVFFLLIAANYYCKKQCDDDIRRLYRVNDKCLLVVDSLGFYSTRTQTPQWILLRQSPKINLDRLIDSLNPELIIWNGSNYRSDQERWKLSCKTKKSLSIKQVKRAHL